MSQIVTLYHHALQAPKPQSGLNPQPANLHDLIYQTLEATVFKQDGKRWFDTIKDQQRLILYWDAKTSRAVIRSATKPPEHLGFKTTTHQINKGEVIRLQVRLACQKNTSGQPGKNFLQRIGMSKEEFLASDPRGKGKYKLNAAEKKNYVTNVLKNAGLAVDKLHLSPNYSTAVRSIKFNVQTVDVTAICTIEDVKRFADALKFGIGRYKTYGFGLIRFQKIEHSNE